MARARFRYAVLGVLVLLVSGAHAQPAGAIVGGQPAAPGYFGYVTFVGAVVGDGTAYYCTGALVAPSVVLTAAHCATLLTDPNPASRYTVGTGRVQLDDATTGQVLAVSNVVVPPNWDPATLRGDVALLQLAQPSTAATMPIASASDASWAYQPGNTIIVAGWGRTSPSSPASSHLNWIDLSIQDDDFCTDELADVTPAYDQSSMFCASRPGSADGACNGDSGAPAVARSATGEFEIIGVTSLMADHACAPPDAFARVTFVSPWLTNAIATLQASAPLALPPVFAPPPSPVLVPLSAGQPSRTRASLTTHPAVGVPGKLAKLTFHASATSGRVRVRLRIFNRGVVVYSRTTRYFQPTARARSLGWRVPRRLAHSIRFCMSATLYASAESSAPSCSTLRITRPQELISQVVSATFP